MGKNEVAVEWTCKPDSVPLGIAPKAGVIMSLELELPRISSDLPEDLGRASLSQSLVLSPQMLRSS